MLSVVALVANNVDIGNRRVSDINIWVYSASLSCRMANIFILKN